MNLAERLSDYSCRLTYEDLGGRTILEAKKRVVDALGCAVGAFDAPPVKAARAYVSKASGSGRSTIFGTGKKTTPDVATFVNGLMIRYFDFNDTYLSKEPAHPSDNLAATMSVAESEGASGKDLILATALAYEIQCRLCDAADIRHRGWDHVCYGLVSSSLAAAKLLKLDRRKMTQAVNISLNSHLAMRQVRAGELSMWKGASFSNAARNAVFSALLAREGMTGPSPIFEGEMGFFKQVSGPFELDVGKFGRSKKGFKLDETYVKYYPAEYHAQTAVRAALDLRKRIRNPDEIESVEILTHEAGFTILGKDREKWRPTTKETADHSLPYMVGMALLEGKLDNETYADEKIRSEKSLEFLDKIEVKEDERLTALYPGKGMPNRVTVRTKSGKSFAEEVVVPKGHPLNPMSKREIEAKFRGLVKGRIPDTRADRLLDLLWGLDGIEQVAEVTPLMVAA